MQPPDLFQNQLYLNLETFRKNGEGVKTPVWFVQDGETLLATTYADSGKMKRVRKNARVNIAPCTIDGALLGPWCPALARESVRPGIKQTVNQVMDLKYGEIKKQYEAQEGEDTASARWTILELNLEG